MQRYFPASGYRLGGSGVFSNVGVSGFGRSSSPNGWGSVRGGCWGFGETAVYPLYYDYRTEGFPVRCVQELTFLLWFSDKILFLYFEFRAI